MDRRDLALEAAFTSMSLRERWRDPGVDGTLDPTSLLLVMLPPITLFTDSGRFRLSCEDDEDRSDWGRDTMLSELFR